MTLTSQVYLVAGGAADWKAIHGPYMTSTETLKQGDTKWTLVGNLPNAAIGIRGTTLNNKIIMTGV